MEQAARTADGSARRDLGTRASLAAVKLLPKEQLSELLLDAIETSAERRREEFALDLASVSPILVAVAGPMAAADVGCLCIDVAEWLSSLVRRLLKYGPGSACLCARHSLPSFDF